ncbi:MAG: glycosyltransferase [Syntrophales bacterium]|nr:glycosyltransferase [Syntrophales bacterium]
MNGKEPTLSVITPSLNHGKYLRATVESILAQSYDDWEHIVVDGGSTDETIEILESYSHIKWISERETDKNTILEAYRKAFSMSRGRYIIQCCVTDGFLHKDWFRMCVDILESDRDISLVWGLPQRMSSDGVLGKIHFVEFLDRSPPQKKEFLPFWLATGFGFPEGNYCVRRRVFDICFPKRGDEDLLSLNPAWGFNYRFNTLGYLPFFLPIIANYGRKHENQRGIRLYDLEDKASHFYRRLVDKYKILLLKGSVTHYFRDGDSEIIDEVRRRDLGEIMVKVYKYKVKQKIRKRFQEFLEKL